MSRPFPLVRRLALLVVAAGLGVWIVPFFVEIRRDAATGDPLAESALLDAERMLVQGRYSQAEEIAAARRRNGGSEVVSGWIEARAAESRGRPDLAVGKLRAILQASVDPALDPSLVPNALAADLLRIGRFEEALATTSPGSRNGPSAWLESRALLGLGRIPEATAALVRAGAAGAPAPLDPEPASYVGEAVCRKCHAKAFDAHRGTKHAATLTHGDSLTSIPFPAEAVPDPTAPLLSHRFVRGADGRVRVESRRGDQAAEALIEYALGSGRQGISFNVRAVDGSHRVHRISLIGDRSGRPPAEVGKTIFQDDGPADAGSAVGRLLSDDERLACLGCHATTARAAFERTGPEAADRAIGCEGCHGPGGNHVRAVELKWTDMAIGSPKRATADQVVRLCGRCHDNPKPTGPPAADPLTALGSAGDPEEVRLQSRTLPKSLCYTRSEGGLDCLVCHDPHRDAERSPGYYESKCLECHSADESKRLYKSCPVDSKTGCVSCHMPKDARSIPHSVFTDHHIRVRPGGRR